MTNDITQLEHQRQTVIMRINGLEQEVQLKVAEANKLFKRQREIEDRIKLEKRLKGLNDG